MHTPAHPGAQAARAACGGAIAGFRARRHGRGPTSVTVARGGPDESTSVNHERRIVASVRMLVGLCASFICNILATIDLMLLPCDWLWRASFSPEDKACKKPHVVIVGFQRRHLLVIHGPRPLVSLLSAVPFRNLGSRHHRACREPQRQAFHAELAEPGRAAELADG